jgi:uncharacterized protein
MPLSRRDFLSRTAMTGAGLALIGSTEMLLTAPNAAAVPCQLGYGPLVPDPAGKLSLPAGFRYSIVTQAGVTTLDSGEPTPGSHDGAGAFRRPEGGTVIVYNHEIRNAAQNPPVPRLSGLTYDPAQTGGCTIVEVDPDGQRVSERVGIAGTSTNCAGGVTPWDTWLTCEEVFIPSHGYVFEVDPFDQQANQDPRPIKALGRFEHEAAVVDPHRGNIYLTEDAAGPNGLFYRWEAPRGFHPRKGALRELADTAGTLAAMHCTDTSGAHVDDLSRATEVGTHYHVSWTPVPDRDATQTPVRQQLPNDQITRGRKLEGAWWGDGGTYVVCSYARAESPGAPHDGQVWFLDPNRQTLTLRLRFGVNPTPDQDGPYDGPDNITVSPYGGLILAEDGEGIQHLIGVTEHGETFPLARNDAGADEFTGPVFSPDRRILFANVQGQGIMYAITGPWRGATTDLGSRQPDHGAAR